MLEPSIILVELFEKLCREQYPERMGCFDKTIWEADALNWKEQSV